MFTKRREREAAEQATQLEFLERCSDSAHTFRGVTADEARLAGVAIPIVLKRDERMYLTSQGAALVEARRAAGHWQGRSQGVSVRVPGTKSMRYRVGTNRGTYVQGEEQPTPIDEGTFTITTTRAVFVGGKQTREWLWSKLLGVQHSEDAPWSALAVSNRQKTSGILYDNASADHLRFTLDLAIARASGTDDDFASSIDAALEVARSASPSELVADVSPAEAGWLADPSGRFAHRYWDGGTWTEHVATDGISSTDPL